MKKSYTPAYFLSVIMYSPLRLLTISFSIVLLTACQQPPSSDQNGTVTILALDPLF